MHLHLFGININQIYKAVVFKMIDTIYELFIPILSLYLIRRYLEGIYISYSLEYRFFSSAVNFK